MMNTEVLIPHFFGVRHLSPGSAWHLLDFLNSHKPQCVLLESPADMHDTLMAVTHQQVKPPVALMLYTTQLPIASVLYPLAVYSPEYQAVRWAQQHTVELRCIDLPSAISLHLQQQSLLASTAAIENPPDSTNEALQTEESTADQTSDIPPPLDYYQHLAEQFGEPSYDDYWERHFESSAPHFQDRLLAQVHEMRGLSEAQEHCVNPQEYARNHLRESFMLAQIQQALDDGFQPQDIVVIVGAYHVPSLKKALSETSFLTPLTLNEQALLGSTEVRAALMPYSYQRLNSRVGYGAGNAAPYYFQMLWEALQNDNMANFPAHYLSTIATHMRRTGAITSTASVIEAVRLTSALATFRQYHRPTLSDLHDVVVTCFGHGDMGKVASAIVAIDVGTEIGFVPEGVSQTPLQDDFKRELHRLKLYEYQSATRQELRLDLRENRRVKTEAAAWIDLHRSTFFHRLAVLGIPFSRFIPAKANDSSWAESWTLQWSPEVEMTLVEANLHGESIANAAGYLLHTQLEAAAQDTSQGITTVARVTRSACECQLPLIFHQALSTLQGLATEHIDFQQAAQVAYELSALIRYGDLRRINTDSLIPLLQQLFVRASLIWENTAHCDDDAAKALLPAISLMESVSQTQYDVVNSALWLESQEKVAFNDQCNPMLSGVGLALLLEHNAITEERCSQEISLRLSVGVPASLAAAWFEGLASRNRYALLSRTSLWKTLDTFIGALDEEDFYRCVVFLRRTFGQFENMNIQSITSLLSQFWGQDEETTALAVQELSAEDTAKLDDLNEFDFDF